MPDLYGQGAQLLEGAGRQASDTANREQDRIKTTVQAGTAASGELGAERQQSSSDQARMALEMMRQKFETVEITPQLALGLVKNTGDKSWLQSVGQRMRSDVYTGLYTHGLYNRIVGKEYKVPVGDKVETMIIDLDPTTMEIKPRILGEGERFSPTQKGEDTPKAQADRASRERIAKEKQSSKGGGGSGSKADPKDKEFLKTYRTYQRETEGINYMLLDQMAKKDPKQAKDLRTKLDFVEQQKDRFNELQGVKGEEGQPSNQDDQKAIEYLKKNYPQLTNPTPEDISWAKGKLGG